MGELAYLVWAGSPEVVDVPEPSLSVVRTGCVSERLRSVNVTGTRHGLS